MKQKMRSKGESCCGEGIWGLTDKIQRETERISELRSVKLICSGRLSPDVGGWGGSTNVNYEKFGGKCVFIVFNVWRA